MAKKTDGFGVLNPNLGLYLDRIPLAVPKGGMTDCLNVRLLNGRVTNANMGFEPFNSLVLNGPALLISNFFLRSGAQVLIFGSNKDLYRFDEDTLSLVFLTPREEVGTVSATQGSATVTRDASGADWLSKLKPGDEIFIGAIGQTDPAAAWAEIASVDSDTQITLVQPFGGATVADAAYTARRRFTGTIFDFWLTETFPNAAPALTDLWFATNKVDPIVTWDGIADQVTLQESLGFRCGALARMANQMIYVNLVLDGGEARPYSIRTSAIGTPLDTVNGAEFIASDGVDPLLVAAPLGDNLVIYGSRSITLAQFVGDPLGWVFRGAVSGLGPQTARALADFGDYHEFIGPDTGYRFDGVNVEEVGSQIWREVLRKHDPKRLGLAFTHFDEEHGDLLWCVPLTTDGNTEDGQPERAYVEHYLEDVGTRHPQPYTLRELPMTTSGYFERLDTLTFDEIAGSWAEQEFRWNDRFFQAAFPLNLFGDADGNIYQINTAGALNGAEIVSFARFGRFMLVDERHKGLVRRIYPFAETRPGADYDLGVILWTAEQAGGALTHQGQLLYDLTQAAESNRFVSPFRVGRFAEVEFATTGINRVWTLQGFDLDVSVAGAR